MYGMLSISYFRVTVVRFWRLYAPSQWWFMCVPLCNHGHISWSVVIPWKATISTMAVLIYAEDPEILLVQSQLMPWWFMKNNQSMPRIFLKFYFMFQMLWSVWPWSNVMARPCVQLCRTLHRHSLILDDSTNFTSPLFLHQIHPLLDTSDFIITDEKASVQMHTAFIGIKYNSCMRV